MFHQIGIAVGLMILFSIILWVMDKYSAKSESYADVYKNNPFNGVFGMLPKN